MNVADFEPLFAMIEKAVDAHPKLDRLLNKAMPETATIKVSRYGFSAEITVKLNGSRKRPSEIMGAGDTAEEAAQKLVESLDYWAEAIK